MAIVLVLIVLVVLDVFRLFTRSTGLSHLGLLVAAVVRALIPLSAAIGIGSWQLIRAFEGIAASGRVGRDFMARGPEQLVLTLLTGVIGFAVVLVLALVLAARSRVPESDLADRGSRPR